MVMMSPLRTGTPCFLSSTMLSLPSQISQRRFPRKLWTFTTSLAVQANYGGWLLGALIPPQLATDSASLEQLCLIQALVATPILGLYFLLYKPATNADVQRGILERSQAAEASGLQNSFARSITSVNAAFSPPTQDPNAAHNSTVRRRFYELFLVGKMHPCFVLQIVACGLLGGVSFAQPSAAIFILKPYGFSNSVSAYVNVCFISAGVVFGTLLGKVCSEPKHFGIVLKVLFALCLLCSAGCAFYTRFLDASKPSTLIPLLIMSGGVGLCSLGFIGIGIEASALYPVGAGYVCWAIEIIVQGVGGALNLFAANEQGFWTLLIVVVASFVLLLVGYRLPVDV